MAYQTLHQEYMQIPPVTRTYTSFCLLTSALVVSKLFYAIRICNNNNNSVQVFPYYYVNYLFHPIVILHVLFKFITYYFGN